LKIISKPPKIEFDTSTDVARIEVYFLDFVDVNDWCVNYYNKSGEPINAIDDSPATSPTYFAYKKDAVRYAKREMGYFETCKEIRVFSREYNLLHKVIHKGGPTITLSKEDAIILDNNIWVA
tara:strand:- start:572 stop:937 length:366 start_codon:yes stop_codon:yes gene_type:complete